MRRSSTITVTDQFCGAGGSSLGASRIPGIEIKLALNHWKLAIETHNTNFPNTLHDCTDIQACDPRRYPHTDILITSPECFPVGTLILTDRGLVPIEDVNTSDLVLTHQNRWRPVTSVMVTSRPTVTIRGQGHRGLEVSADHPFYVRQQGQVWNNQKRDYERRILKDAEWRKASELKSETFRWASPSCVPFTIPPAVSGENGRYIDFTPEFWWMVGRWLGDGSVRLREDYSSEITICCGKAEVEELEALRFAPRQGAHAKQGELHWRKREIRTSFLFECVHDSLARWLVEHFGKDAHGKTLPTWALGMRQDWREALLAGYVSSDGYVTTRYTLTSSVSKRLSLGIRLLVTGLGYHPTFGCYHHKAGQIEGRPFDAYDMWIVRWENNKSQRTGINDGQHSWTLVKDVSSIGETKDVYNLSVADDESYVADGIVVHNCTNHSVAKGVKRNNQAQMELWANGQLDPAAEKSRATMWDVPRFAEYHEYRAIIVENVVDARRWRLWDAWLHAMHSLDYQHEIVYFNSMFAHPTPQSRDRMYVVFWKKGNKRPNLKITPRAYCSRCAQDVDSVQVWKNQDKKWGKYGKRNQYIYACPRCAKPVDPYYFAAANAIDWSIPGERIGDRKKPLKPRTMDRIEYGLRKFARPFTTRYDGTHQRGADEPMNTMTTRDANALVMPFMVETAYTHAGEKRVYDSLDPMNTQSTRQTMAIVQPFIIAPNDRSLRAKGVDEALPTQLPARPGAVVVPPYIVEFWGTSTAREADQPLSTVEAGANHHGVVVPPFMFSFYGERPAVQDVTDPMVTMTTMGNHAVVQPFIINSAGDLNPRPVSDPLPTQVAVRAPFFVSYYGADQGAHGITDPLGTQSTHDRHGLVQPGSLPDVEDCFFRMLQPREIGRAMAFDDSYVVLGNQRDQVRQYGNAVTPPVMEMLVSRIMETFK